MRVPRKSTPSIKFEDKTSEDSSEGAWLFVGLGNPGCKYQGTRHNVGFDTLDRIAKSEGITFQNSREASVARGHICGSPIILAKPSTFMNRSGKPVSRLMALYKVPLERLVVIHDDLDLKVAQLRLKSQGSSGGHNGMQDVIQSLGGAKKIARLRIGIDRPTGFTPIALYVLLKFTKEEQAIVDVAILEAAEVLRQIISKGIDKTMCTINTKNNRK
eukprot:CAMPEP_0196583878 /NCGR_PEP_ID=MMETSP1081-20130531/45069_1 /TAXON_ID=36882 /ORGANISM="Pyramimonas amylifera, Strain CCMP720" /LENGTH=215 /DNA_ID=CAMNT_0041904913 /DNA_START=278 /DNA_END=925 /DNA_ORIENTATION=-